MILKPTLENQESNLDIRRLLTEKAIGTVIEGPYRTLILSFPNDREGVVVELGDEMGSKSLDFTLDTGKSAPGTLWQKIRHAFDH